MSGYRKTVLQALLLSLALSQAVSAQNEAEVEVVDQVVVAEAAVEAVDMNLPLPVELNDPTDRLIKRYLTVQVALAKRACDLEKPQLDQLAKLDDRFVKDLRKKLNKKNEPGLVRGVLRFLGGEAPVQQQNNPEQLLPKLREKVDESVLSALTEEQREAFISERNSARHFRLEAHAQLLIAALDRHLFLADEQRESLIKDVTQWLLDENSELYWQFYFQNNQYVPKLPRNLLKKHLDENQISAMNGLQTYNYSSDQMEFQNIQNFQVDFVIVDEP